MKTNQIHKYIESATTKTIIKLLFFFILKKKRRKMKQKENEKEQADYQLFGFIALLELLVPGLNGVAPDDLSLFCCCHFCFPRLLPPLLHPTILLFSPSLSCSWWFAYGVSFSCAPLSPLNMQISFGPFKITPLSTCD